MTGLELLGLALNAAQQLAAYQQTLMTMQKEGRSDLTDEEVAAVRAQAMAHIRALIGG